jgi:hypothetical protein
MAAMASQTRKTAADRRIGELHPYATLYGWVIFAAILVAAMIGLVAVAWSHRPDLPNWNWSAPDGGSSPVVLIGLLAPLTIALLWIWLSPSRRFDRKLRRATRGL